MFMNAQSLGNKMNELCAVVCVEWPDIIAVNETWTNDAIPSGLLNIPDYEIIGRSDRTDTAGGRGGGLIVYARKEMCVWNCAVGADFNQCISFKIKCGCEDVNVHSVYRSPNSSVQNDEQIAKWIMDLRGTNILIGDFNFPDVDWEAGTSGARGRRFYEATQSKFMEQHVVGPTHISGSTLDLILSDREGIVSTVSRKGRLGKSDHEIVCFKLRVDAKRERDQQARLNYRRAKYNEMQAKLSETEWEIQLEGKAVNEMWICIRDRIHEAIHEHTPMKKIKRRNEPPWMNSKMKKSIRDKRRAWTKWKETGRDSDKTDYKKKEAETKRMIKNGKNSWERRIMECRKTKPKLFYSHLNRAKSTKS